MEGRPDDDAQQENEEGAPQHDLVVLAEQIGFQSPGDEVDLEHAVVAPGRPHGQHHRVDPHAAAPVLDDGRLPRVSDGAMTIERHTRFPAKEIRVDSSREVPVQQPDADDLGLLHDQVLRQALDFRQLAGAERILDRQPDRRARDVHAQVELRSPLRALFADEEEREARDDQHHRHEEK
jgi:hypothetical protein